MKNRSIKNTIGNISEARILVEKEVFQILQRNKKMPTKKTSKKIKFYKVLRFILIIVSFGFYTLHVEANNLAKPLFKIKKRVRS